MGSFIGRPDWSGDEHLGVFRGLQRNRGWVWTSRRQLHLPEGRYTVSDFYFSRAVIERDVTSSSFQRPLLSGKYESGSREPRLRMTFRIRFFGTLVLVSFFSSIISWFTGYLPLIYMVPLLILAAFSVVLSCPRCGKSPFHRRVGPFIIGVPWLPSRRVRPWPGIDELPRNPGWWITIRRVLFSATRGLRRFCSNIHIAMA
jgi:hypothetical protein